MFWLVDIFKFVFALFIVGLHSWFLGQFKDWLYPITFYSAVPYFFIASGFFFGKKYYTNQNSQIENRNIQIFASLRGGVNSLYSTYYKRLFTKLVIFEPLSQLQVIAIQVLTGIAGLTILTETVQHIIFYPLGAMWYIQALIVAGLILLPFMRWHKEKFILPVGLLLYLFALICGGYYFIIEDIPIVANFVDKYLYYCISPKNGLFIGFLYMGLGVLAAKNWDTETKKFRFKSINVLLLISAIIFFTELYLVRDHRALFLEGQYYLTQPLFVLALFLFSAKYYENPSLHPKHDTIIFRNLSISIYLLHAPVQYFFSLLQTVIGIQSNLLGNPYSYFLLTLIVILLIIYPVYKKKPKCVYGWIV